MTGSANNLERLIVALEAGNELPADVAEWLLEGFLSFRESGGRDKLCSCLGLRGPGKRSLAGRAALEERNRWLRKAWHSMSVSADTSDWEKTIRLASTVRRFGSIAWPRLRKGPPPKDPIRQALFHAFRTDTAVPSTPRMLWAIVTERK